MKKQKLSRTVTTDVGYSPTAGKYYLQRIERYGSGRIVSTITTHPTYETKSDAQSALATVQWNSI